MLEERARYLIAVARRFLDNGISRGGRAAQIKRLQWQLDRQNAALGQAIYPFLFNGEVQLQADLPDVRAHVTRIAALVQSLETLQHSRNAPRTDTAAKNEDEDRWADEGGQNIG